MQLRGIFLCRWQDICSPLRSRLSPDLLEALACLYCWKRQEFGIKDPRQKKRNLSCERFAKLSLVDLTPLIPDTDTSAEEDDEEDIQENFSADLAEEGIDGIAIQEEDDQLIIASEARLRHEENERTDRLQRR